jgi:predicted TIM-barrel fold metal-dependent hydrolase
MARTRPLPSLIAGLSSEEYDPPRPNPAELRAREAVSDRVAQAGCSSANAVRNLLDGRTTTATVLRTLDAEAGGGFFAVPVEAEHSDEAAEATFARGHGSYVIDVQTHLVSPDRWRAGKAEALAGFLRMVDPDRWGGGIDPELLSGASWAQHLFGESETNIALLTSLPGRAHENVLTNREIAACRDLVDRYAGTNRVLTHTIVHPNAGPEEVKRLPEWAEDLRPAGWKVYTLWDPPELIAPGGVSRGWFLDDERIGIPFLEAVRRTTTKIVCAHKGIGAPIPGASPEGSSPRDIGPVAVRYPDLVFVVYHSGYELDPDGQEGAYEESTRGRGVNRLIASLEESGVKPGSNVYAEIGSTWYLALRRPEEAAHILGKLLKGVGEDRVLWGTDSIWYGSPQSLIDAFWSFQIPERLQVEYGYSPLTTAVKEKILWRNAAGLYDVAAEDLAAATSPMDSRELRAIRSALSQSASSA